MTLENRNAIKQANPSPESRSAESNKLKRPMPDKNKPDRGKKPETPPPEATNSQTDREKKAANPKTVSNILGEITWLMTQSANHRYFFISDLEWMVLQPVSLGQFRMFLGEKFPVGVAFWAFVSKEVEDRLVKGITKMKPGDWKSGESLWLIDLVSPFGNIPKMLEDLTQNVFPDRTFKYLQRNEEGNMVVMESRKASQTATPESNG